MTTDSTILNMPLTWDDISLHAKSLARKLSEKAPSGGWTGIVAITTGGMVPACVVARHMGIKLIDTLSISSYDDQSQRAARILKQAATAGDGAGWIVIDDLADTGNTFRVARDILPKAHYATLYTKPLGEPTVDTFIMSVSQNTWLHFPWEDNEASYIPPNK